MIEPTTGVKPVPSVSSGADQRRGTGTRPDSAEAPPVHETVTGAVAEAVERTLKSLQPPLMGQNERLSILKDEATGLFVYRSIDKETGNVIRQWPAESMLQFRAYLRQEGVAYDSLA